MSSLDLRLPIGLLFSLLGVLLLGFGAVSDPAIYQASLGINVNLWWGLVLARLRGGDARVGLAGRAPEEPIVGKKGSHCRLGTLTPGQLLPRSLIPTS